ncbi:hypothetical protein PGB90_001272 [Kerria lacca]
MGDAAPLSQEAKNLFPLIKTFSPYPSEKKNYASFALMRFKLKIEVFNISEM